MAARAGIRVVCYCDDCRAYLRWLEREDLLDAHGGTEIFQTRPARVRIEQGTGEVRCVRLSERGMMRWFTGCCHTPIGNTMASARVPFVGLVHGCWDLGEPDRDGVLGEATFVQGRFALGQPPPHVHRTAPLGLIVRSVRLLAGGWWAGAHRPSPFFDSGGPIADPRVLTAEERAPLYVS